MAVRAPKPLDIEGLMEYAARALSARAYSVSELRIRLKNAPRSRMMSRKCSPA